MKNKYYLLALSILMVGLVACEEKSGKEEKSVVKVPKLNFTDHQAVVRAVDKYLSQNTLEKGLVFLSLRDEVTKKDLYLSPPTGYDSVSYASAENVVSLGVKMHPNDTKDVYLVDFRCEWDANFMVNDSVQGGIKITSIDIRSVNEKPRYKWQKQTKYWDKVPVLVQ